MPQGGEEKDRRDQPETQEATQCRPVAFSNAVDDLSTRLNNQFFSAVLAAEQDSGKRGRQGERVECRNGDRKCDGQRELAEQNAGGAGEERHGHKHRDQHQRSGNDCARYFRIATEAALCVSCSPSWI